MGLNRFPGKRGCLYAMLEHFVVVDRNSMILLHELNTNVLTDETRAKHIFDCIALSVHVTSVA